MTEEEQETTIDEKKFKQGSIMTIKLRLLIESTSVGALIGKRGENIKQFNEETGAYFKVLEAGRGGREQVLHVSASSMEHIEAAIRCLVTWFAKQRAVNSEENADIGSIPTQLRMCVFKHQAGLIIGKSGQNVKDIIQETSAKVQILNGFLGPSTEQELQITGIPSAIEKAMSRIILQIQEQEKNETHTRFQEILYIPGSHSHPMSFDYRFGLAGPMHAHAPAPRHMSGPGQHMQGHIQPNHHLQNPAPGMHSHMSYSQSYAPQHYGAGSSFNQQPAYTTQQSFRVPNNLVGYMIGKGGRFVQDVRRLTGATVKFEPQVENSSERSATITGTPDGCNAAVELCKKRLTSYDPNYKKTTSNGAVQDPQHIEMANQHQSNMTSAAPNNTNYSYQYATHW